MVKSVAGFIKSSSKDRLIAIQKKEKLAMLDKENEKQKEQEKMLRLKALRLSKKTLEND